MYVFIHFCGLAEMLMLFSTESDYRQW